MNKLIEGAQVELTSDIEATNIGISSETPPFLVGDRGYIEHDQAGDHVSAVFAGYHVAVPRASVKEIGLEHEVARDMAEAAEAVADMLGWEEDTRTALEADGLS